MGLWICKNWEKNGNFSVSLQRISKNSPKNKKEPQQSQTTLTGFFHHKGIVQYEFDPNIQTITKDGLTALKRCDHRCIRGENGNFNMKIYQLIYRSFFANHDYQQI